MSLFPFFYKHQHSKIDYNKVMLHDVLNGQKYNIDDITGSDLQLEDFRSKYDDCQTTCGSDLFHHWLYSIKNQKEISEIQQDMKLLYDSGEIGRINRYLQKYAGVQKEGCLVRDLWNGFSVHNKVIDNFYVLFFSNLIINTVLSLLFSKYLILFIILFFIINFILFLITNRYVSHVTASLGYFFSLCRTIKKIDKKIRISLSKKIPDYKRFNSLLPYSVFFKQGFGGPSSGDIISLLIDYFRVFFAFELFSFKIVEKSILKNQDTIRNIYLYIGYLDCLINSLYIIEENNCCYSELSEAADKIDFENMRHPLVENSLGQSKCINTNLIVTGLNMSGKTTFMKSTGINQLLATSFGFCFADRFTTSIRDVLSSICINDSLLNGKSRYYAEAERLVAIKKILKDHSCLCLIDEILSGTNSEERIEGSTKILKDFGSYNSIMIAATHDTQIAQNLSQNYHQIYFDGEIVDDHILFDYKIKEGIVSKKNGLLILKLLEKE